MNIKRILANRITHSVRNHIKWKVVDAIIDFKTGETLQIEVPEHWSDTAANILASKYLRKAGVPNLIGFPASKNEDAIPDWLKARLPLPGADFGGETSAHQVFHRLAGHWTYTGWKHGYFEQKDKTNAFVSEKNAEENARAFYDEIYTMLALQMAAPNSPQWFNCGLWWAYGIEGDDTGSWRISNDGTTVQPTTNSYEFPQLHACFINKLEDNLVDKDGILDLLAREARIFKFGSGAGTNFSILRGKEEKMSGGGKSSGLMSFLKIFDVSADAIQSGGTTRRAARMVCVDANHPEIEDFITWKSREERKARAMQRGSASLSAEDDGPIYSADWEGEAIKTVSGQNANNSIRILDEFLKRVDNNESWNLINRVDRTIAKTLLARDLWNLICKSAWESADPGVQFHDTINRWHTCKTDGQINASNPCSEYMFLDDTGCNLASLNLTKFSNEKGEFQIDLFEHCVRLWTMVLDISVQMGSYPSKSIAENTRKYRTLGLGYANAGGLLMRLGIPYDSDKGRDLIGSITALIQGTSLDTSNELANELGPFPRWTENANSMINVIEMHARATSELPGSLIRNQATMKYAGNYTKGGFRNAQVSVIAPTGTISLVMDCETSGIEPELALRKGKKLAGGGSMSLGNSAVEPGLIALGYKGHERNLIMTYISQHSTVEGCPDIKPEHLAVFDCANAPDGFTRCLRPEVHILMMAAAQPFISGAISKTVNLPSSATVEDFDRIYRMAHQLGLKSVAAYRDKSKTAQPLSAGIKSKFEEAMQKHGDALLKHALKTVTETSDATRLLDQAKEAAYKAGWNDREDELITATKRIFPEKPPFPPTLRGHRAPLPFRVEGGYRQKVRINGETVYIRTGEYSDGRLAEIWLTHAREGSTARAYLEGFAKTISIGLQYGVPLEEYVEAFLHTKFEPSGFVENHERIKQTSSIFDYLVRDLAIHYLKRDDLGEIRPEEQVRKELDERFSNLNAMSFVVPPEIPEPKLGSSDYIFSADEPKRMVPRRESSGRLCGKCGHTMRQTGSCYTCPNCGENTGCG